MSERTDRYEEQVAVVVGLARQARNEWLARQVVGQRFTVDAFQGAMFELHHAIGVLDMDGIEPDDE